MVFLKIETPKQTSSGQAQTLKAFLMAWRFRSNCQDNTKIITYNTKIIALNCRIPTNITNMPTIWLDYLLDCPKLGEASPTSPHILHLGGIQQQKTQLKVAHLLKHAGSPVLCDAPALHLSNLSPGKIWDFFHALEAYNAVTAIVRHANWIFLTHSPRNCIVQISSATCKAVWFSNLKLKATTCASASLP